MSGLCKVTIVGHLGRDPEMRYISSGTAVTALNVAASRKYTTDGKEMEETIWVRVSAWGKLAEACASYLAKGSLVYVEGNLTPDPSTGGPRIWEDKEGKPRASFEINANTVLFLSQPKERTDRSIQPMEDF